MNLKIWYIIYGEPRMSPAYKAAFMCMRNCDASWVFIRVISKSSGLIDGISVILEISVKILYVMKSLFFGARIMLKRVSLKQKAAAINATTEIATRKSTRRNSSKWSQKVGSVFSIIIFSLLLNRFYLDSLQYH